MIDGKDTCSSGLGALLGQSSDSLGGPLPNPRKMALRRLHAAIKADDADEFESAFDDVLDLSESRGGDGG